MSSKLDSLFSKFDQNASDPMIQNQFHGDNRLKAVGSRPQKHVLHENQGFSNNINNPFPNLLQLQPIEERLKYLSSGNPFSFPKAQNSANKDFYDSLKSQNIYTTNPPLKTTSPNINSYNIDGNFNIKSFGSNINTENKSKFFYNNIDKNQKQQKFNKNTNFTTKKFQPNRSFTSSYNNNEFHRVKSLSLNQTVKKLIPPEDSMILRLKILENTRKIIKTIFPTSDAKLFGSTSSGLYTIDSDVDICIELSESDMKTIEIPDTSDDDTDIEKEEEEEDDDDNNNTEDESENKKKKRKRKLDPMTKLRSIVVTKLSEIFENSNGLCDIVVLPRARVPILKFVDEESNITCDVGINNLLAVRNSEMIKLYMNIDNRVVQLSYCVKHWAKLRGINDPYHCTLSSYAYILMLINFLQIKKPPVLPCLQRLNIEDCDHIRLEGYDCSYFTDLEYIRSHGFGPTSYNKENIGSLLCEFFGYFGHEFDYKKSVVSVRTGRLLTRIEKDWTRSRGRDRHFISIEDPFELNHDLGNVVVPNALYRIRGEFMRAHRILSDNNNDITSLFHVNTKPIDLQYIHKPKSEHHEEKDEI